jgi:hypothetical protein
MKTAKLIFLLLVFFAMGSVKAQNGWNDIFKDDKNDTIKGPSLVQFSGIVVTSDSLKPVPFVNIADKTTRRGTTSDYFGFFSFVAQQGDTIIFSSVGYKRATVIIPDSLTEDRYSLIQMMQSDTIKLAPAHIFPWPTRPEFEKAFLNLELKPDEMMARAERNMKLADMKEAAMTMNNDGNMAFRNQMQKEYTKMYYAGQVPTSNLLNPIAWAQFVQAWKRGDFKRE